MPPPSIYEEFQQRLAQRDALLLLRGQLRNQLHALVQRPVVVAQVRERMETLDQTMTAQIMQIETELLALVESEEKPVDREQEWLETIVRLQSIPGIGLLTAMWIVVCTLNFTICSSAEQAAAYAGLAPMPRQSGTSVKTRPCIGHTGNGRLRTALYLATLSAARYNPVIKRFYDRLRAQGKPAKVARCAAARKLLHLAFAVATNKENFDPDYQPKSKQQAARA
jgi:transposase